MSPSPRSTRTSMIPVLAGIVVALAGCRDSTGVDGPKSLGRVVAPTAIAPASVSSSVPQMLIYGTYAGGDLLQQYLGGTPTRSVTLPDDLTPYKVIWYMHYESPMSDEDRAKLVAFVKGGGGLYLSGEGNCCAETIGAISVFVHALVKNSGNIQVGGLGNVDPVGNYFITPNTEIASLPNSLGVVTAWTTISAGGMLNVLPQNQFITSNGADIVATTVAAAWDGPSLVGDYGRLVVMMDANWLDPNFFNAAHSAVLGNITRYLSNAPKPNPPPIAGIDAIFPLVEGKPVLLSSAPTSDPGGLNELVFEWDLDNDGSYDDYTGPGVFKTFDDNGSYTIGLRVTDEGGASGTTSLTLLIRNRDPIMTFAAPGSVVEGSAITLATSEVEDAAGDQASLTITYSCDGGVTFGATAGCPAVDGPATVNVVGRVKDKDGGFTDYAKTVSVTNAAPAIASLTLPSAPVPIGTAVSLAATFSDPWTNDGHTATIDWDDASTSAATAGAPNAGAISATHTYSTSGVYTVTLTVRDDANASDVKSHQYVVVYDPSAGFVTGGGWIAYDASACLICSGAAGRGDFGFVSKYKKGANVPTGDTRFEFHFGTLAFESVEYEWLVVSGKRAQYKGRGTINGLGDYGFVLTAVDDATDAFRIKIWNRSTSVVVFDNKMGASDESPDATLLNKVSGNGSIVIHAK